jgi:hypothetical protein
MYRLLLLLVLLPACAPSISPLYRDYAVTPVVDTAVEGRLRTALTQAGWTLAPADAPGAVTTEARTFRTWGLYRVEMSLEAVPIGGHHVRVYVHAHRQYVTGSRSKIPYLRRSLARAVFPDLNEAFTEQGLTFLGTDVQRDRVATQR